MGCALLCYVALLWLDCFYGDLGGKEALVVDLVLQFGVVGVGVLVTDLLLFSRAVDLVFTFACS
jgi:hypothetical protein